MLCQSRKIKNSNIRLDKIITYKMLSYADMVVFLIHEPRLLIVIYKYIHKIYISSSQTVH